MGILDWKQQLLLLLLRPERDIGHAMMHAGLRNRARGLVVHVLLLPGLLWLRGEYW
jgi:hypothetical protein